MSRNIKSEKIIQVMIIPGKEEKIDLSEGLLQSWQEFDEKGNLCLEITYGSNGLVTDKNVFRYDDQGRLVETVIYDEEDEVLETRKLMRDENGLVNTEQICYLDGSVDTIRYAYEGGLLAEKVQVTDEDEVEMREVYTYEQDRLIRYEWFNNEGSLVHRTRNSYTDGKIVESHVFSAEGGEPYTMIVRYSESGRKIEELKYDSEERLIERNRSEEDESGHVVRIVEENTFRSNTTELEYDDLGRLSRQVERDLHGELISDIKRTYHSDGLPEATHVTVRDRMTGVYQQYYLLYEYRFHEGPSGSTD